MTEEQSKKMCWKCGKLFATSIENCPDDNSRLLPISSDDQKDPMIGSLFDDRFRIFKKLGEGGMGNVYGARQIDFERDVALKILKSDFVRNEDIRKRFMYEARSISKLKHPNVLRIFDFGSAPDGSFYMVMELLEGESLADRLAYRFLTYREIYNAIPPICGVLSEAHKNDVIHRDLKPENVFLVAVNEDEEFAKLLDFGIAKHLSDTSMTKSGTLWGTPAYMSPEQAKGETVGGPADTYGIGIMLYELICGNLPFNASTQMGLALKQIQLKARRLSTIPGLEKINTDLDDLVIQCLEKDPRLRPGDINEVADRLKTIAESMSADELSVVPAEEVDALALQDWIAAEAKVNELVVPEHLKTLDKMRDEVSESHTTISLPRKSLGIAIAIASLALMAFIGVYFVKSDAFVDEVSSKPENLSASIAKTSVKEIQDVQPLKGVTDAASGAVNVLLRAQRVSENMKPKRDFLLAGNPLPEKKVVGKRTKSKRRFVRRRKKKATKAQKKKFKADLEKTF